MMGCILGNIFLFPYMVFATNIPTDHFMYSSKCPKEKPFEGSWSGICVGCDSLSVLEVAYEHEADFDICPNRETDHWISYLKTCPKDAPLRDIQGNCISCNEIKQGVSVKNKENCKVCPGAKYNDGICTMHDCPPERPMRLGSECLSCNSAELNISEKECAKCSKNRKILHGICGFKDSISADMPLISYEGITMADGPQLAKFYACDTPMNVLTTKEHCEKCPNRTYVDNLCILKTTCPKNTFRRLGRTTECIDCDFLGGLITFKEDCNACPNRRFKDGRCILKNCPKGTKRFGDFECSACDSSLYKHGECSVSGGGCMITEPKTKQECMECPNHSWMNGQCIKN